MTQLQRFTKTHEPDERIYKLADGRHAKKLLDFNTGECLMQVIADPEPTSKSTSSTSPVVKQLPPTDEQLAHLESVFKGNERNTTMKTPQAATEQLDALTAKYATEKSVAPHLARVAVMKTAEGKRLYAESVGRAPVHAETEIEPVTKSKRDYEAQLEALKDEYVKTHNVNRPAATVAVMKTAEGKRLYSMARRAEIAGVL